MKKVIICVLMFLCISTLQAQKLTEYIKNIQKEYEMQPAQVVCKTVINDEANGYVKVHENSTYMTEKTFTCREYGIWKWNAGYIYGSFNSQSLWQNGKYVTTNTSVDGSLNLYFSNQDNIFQNIYPEADVKKHFEAKLDELTAKGAQGTEVLFAQIPQKGTSIKLYIVYASELQSNLGMPKWKQEIGSLEFNKEDGKFTFLQK